MNRGDTLSSIDIEATVVEIDQGIVWQQLEVADTQLE
jgi:hypothetical protein